MNETVLGIDLNGVYDSWVSVKTFESPLYRHGRGVAPSVVIAPQSRGEKPLAGKPAIESITGRGWSWPDDAVGPDKNGFSRRIPVLELFKLLNKGKKEIEYGKESFFSVSELIASHLSSLNARKTTSAVVAIPDYADESFQQRIRDASYDAGFDDPRLIWRPVATLLEWGTSLSKERLEETHGSNALVVYLGPLGFEASIMTLEVENSRLGSLLTPVRSSAGKGSTDEHFTINDLAEKLSRHYSKLTGDNFLGWQMLWGTPFVWKKLLGLKSLKTLFQKSDGEFIELLAPEIEIQDSIFKQFLGVLTSLLDDFDLGQLSRVKHVVISGHFLQLSGENGSSLSNWIHGIIKKRVGVNASFHNVVASADTAADPVAKGAAIYAWRLSHDLPTYYDFLPQLEINAISDGRPDFIPLIPKQAKIKGGESYKDDVTQPFFIPPGVPDLEFYIHKEGDQVRKTVTTLREPPKKETLVQLVVKQTPGQGHANVEIRPNIPGIFGPRTLTLDWGTLAPTHKSKTDILKELSAAAGVFYPDHTPVLTHEKVWGQKSTVDLLAEYLTTPHLGSTSDHEQVCKRLKSVLGSKKRGASLGLQTSRYDIFSIVSSNGETPNNTVHFRNWKTNFTYNGPAQDLLSLVLAKIGSEFSYYKNPKQSFFDREQKLQLLFLAATWCYSACPSNVVEYLLNHLERDFVKTGIQAEAASRCVFHDNEITRFFLAAERHCDASIYNQKWAKAITQVLQFREHSAKLLSETQALEFTLMALGIIVSETQQNNFRIKFLWGVLLLMLLFRYRMKNSDFLKADSPQYGAVHKRIKHILGQTLNKVEHVNRRRYSQLKETISILDYKGTNQLIAREVASDIAGSDPNADKEEKKNFPAAKYINLEDCNDNITQTLNELGRMIRHQPSYTDDHTKAITKPNPTPFNYSMESNTTPNADPRYKLQKQSETTINKFFGYKQTSSVSSSPNVPWEMPSANQIKIPLLKLIYKDKLDRDPHSSIPKIAGLFNIPVIELRDRNSEVYKKLFANFTDSIYSLLDDKLIERSNERSKSQIWKITVDGLSRLRSIRAI